MQEIDKIIILRNLLYIDLPKTAYTIYHSFISDLPQMALFCVYTKHTVLRSYYHIACKQRDMLYE